MPIALDPGSRFGLTDPVLVPAGAGNGGGDVETFGVWRPPSFIRTRPPSDLIGRYHVHSGRDGKPDYIAADLYGSQFLDWVLIAFNNATDVLNWPEAGTVIEYPLPSLVFSEID